MKVYYISRVNLSESPGVAKKIEMQADQWVSFGHEVRLAVVGESATDRACLDRSGFSQQTFPATGISQFNDVLKTVFEDISNYRPDVVYLRVPYWLPNLHPILKAFPCVVEVNSDEPLEYRRNHSLLKYLLYMATRERYFRNVKGIVVVSKSISHKLEKFGVPVAVVPNSVSLDRFPALPPATGEQPRLSFIAGAPAAWHGSDKIVKLANHFKNWTFDMIGDTDLGETEAPANMVFHGRLFGQDLQNVLANSDIGISPLAHHRIGIDEISPLKTGEYLAHGLPVIMGYRDTRFLEDNYPFILRLPGCETNVEDNFDRIEEFVKSWKGKRVDRSCVSNIDSRMLEKKRLDFFQSVAGPSGNKKA